MEQYVNAKPDDIRGRLTGVYDLGAGLGEKDFAGEQMQFFRGGDDALPPPLVRHLGARPVPAARAAHRGARLHRRSSTTLILSDLYTEVAAAEGIEVPDDDMAPFEVRLDGVTFDPAKPENEARQGDRRMTLATSDPTDRIAPA